MNAWMENASAPWLWSSRAQKRLWVCLCCVGFALDGLWLGEGETVLRLQQAQTDHQHVLQSIQMLQSNTQAKQQAIAQMAQTPAPLSTLALPRWMQSIKTSATSAGLQVPVMTLRQTPQAPQVQWEVRGPYAKVWPWWQDVQAQAHALVMQQFEMAYAHGQVQLKGLWQLPRTDVSTEPNTLPEPPHEAPHHIGFDHAAWLQAQRWHAQQAPSYVRWVLPELQRVPHGLAQYALHDLRFEGVISKANQQRAVLRVLDASAAWHPLALLAVGDHVGRDHGRVHAITPTHLMVREVVQNAQGEWAPRWVTLPLGRATDDAVARTSEP